jgi:hypothetical protein
MLGRASEMFSTPSTSARRTTVAGPASSHRTTAQALNSRGVRAVETPYVTRFDRPPGCRSAVQDFLAGLLPSQSPPQGQQQEAPDVVVAPPAINNCYLKLLRVFDSKQHDEKFFNKALFGAMAESIKLTASPPPSATAAGDVSPRRMRWLRRLQHTTATPQQQQQQPPPPTTLRSKVLITESMIVLERIVNPSAWGYEFATGLAREVSINPESGGCILGCNARLDHAWVVFCRRVGGTDQDWVVWRALAAVDLKAGRNVSALTRLEGGSVDRGPPSPLLLAGNGPLAQVIMYTLLHVAPGIASLGEELPQAIPFALVACKTRASKTPIEQGWVHGNLVTPSFCGDGYSYSLDAYGPIRLEKGANHSPVAAYLDVMTKGLIVANRFLDRLISDQSLPAPRPISGRELRFGVSTVRAEPPHLPPELFSNVGLVATPVSRYGVEPRPRTAHHPHVRISQGELFQATVNLRALRSALDSPAQNRVFWCRDAHNTPSDDPQTVLIKVSSDSCFDLLIPSGAAYLRHLNEGHWISDGAVREALSRSLLGVYRTPDGNGLVQLLPNLQGGYSSLSPRYLCESANGRSALWRAFAGLVLEVLIPLARADVVHSDVRAGFDVTSNLLYNPADESMRLIDLDSLCTFSRLEKLSDVTDLKNMSALELPDALQSAMGYVLAQVICAAEVWLGRIAHDDVSANATIRRGWSSLRDAAVHPALHVGAIVVAGDVDEALVGVALDHYRAKFD